MDNLLGTPDFEVGNGDLDGVGVFVSCDDVPIQRKSKNILETKTVVFKQ